MKQIIDHFSEAIEVLRKFSTNSNFELIDKSANIMVSAINSGGKIISCGNGGSM